MRLIQDGPRDAKIVLCAEAPGVNEDKQGKPFVGGAGDLLNRMLNNVHLMRPHIFITNVVHTRPPKNKFEWFLKPAIRPEYMAGVLQLQADLKEISPNLVIAMGGQSLQVLTGKIGIMKWRGSILPCTLVPGLKVIGTVHPAYCFKGDFNWPMKAVIEHDLERCAKEALTPELNLPKRTMFINPASPIKRTIATQMAKAEWLSIDIEAFADPTQAAGWRIACVGFSDRANRALVLPWDNPENRNLIKMLCESDAKKVGQNYFGFDDHVLRDADIHTKNYAWDTMCGMHTIYIECAGSDEETAAIAGKKRVTQPALRKGLAFQTSWFSREPYYKADGKLWQATGDLQMFWEYNGKDACVTGEIREEQEKDIKEMGVFHILQREMSMVPVLTDMTRRGVPVDIEEHTRLKKKYNEEIVRLQDFLDTGAGRPINVKSPDVKWLLFDKLGLPVKKRSKKTDAPTADKNVINELALKHPHPLLMTILEIRERRDLIERYLNVAMDNDGRMRCAWDPTGTRTGRLASRTSVYGTGTNLQNQPEELRRMYICDPNKIMFSIDYSQAEARVVAWLARCESLIELFCDPTRDIHTENAARFVNALVEHITFEQRYAAKRTVHASNYGMKWYRFWQIINNDARDTGIRITQHEARQYQEMYFMLYPEIKSVFWHEVREQLKQDLTLISLLGRKRMFYGKWSEQFENEAYSYIPQSTVGDMTNIAMVRVATKIPEADLFINGHDSLIGQCDVDDIESVAAKVQQEMTVPLEVHGRELIIPTDVEVGFNWGKRKTLKDGTIDNPQGLQPLEDWLVAA